MDIAELFLQLPVFHHQILGGLADLRLFLLHLADVQLQRVLLQENLLF